MDRYERRAKHNVTWEYPKLRGPQKWVSIILNFEYCKKIVNSQKFLQSKQSDVLWLNIALVIQQKNLRIHPFMMSPKLEM